MKKIISLINYKGGAGKTTLTCLLSLYLAEVKKQNVRIRDMDKGGDAEAFVTSNICNNLKLFDINEPQQDYDYLLIDAPGGIIECDLTDLAELSDLILVPFALMPTDIRRTRQTCDSLAQYAAKTRLIFNNVNRQTQAFSQRSNVVTALGIPALKHHLSKRVSYGYALVGGLNELTSDCKAELRYLADEIIASN